MDTTVNDFDRNRDDAADVCTGRRHERQKRAAFTLFKS
jgi:hypothetical protein